MRLFKSLLLTVCFILMSSVSQAEITTDWKNLFDGNDLIHWNKIGNANWELIDGAVQADKGVGFLVSKETYRDFEIKVEFWSDDDANSGIFIRCMNPENVGIKNAYEVNIFDKRPEQAYATGAIVDVAKVDPVPKAAGRWNTLEIIARGDQFNVKLNGMVTVANARDSKFNQGPIALQYAAGLIKFRLIQIRKL